MGGDGDHEKRGGRIRLEPIGSGSFGLKRRVEIRGESLRSSMSSLRREKTRFSGVGGQRRVVWASGVTSRGDASNGIGEEEEIGAAGVSDDSAEANRARPSSVPARLLPRGGVS